MTSESRAEPLLVFYRPLAFSITSCPCPRSLIGILIEIFPALGLNRLLRVTFPVLLSSHLLSVPIPFVLRPPVIKEPTPGRWDETGG